MVVNLPVLLGHEVLADEQRRLVENPYPPVKFGVEKFLGQHQIGGLEQLAGDFQQFGALVDLEHPARERAIGNLQHDGIGDLAVHPLQIIAADNDGPGGTNAMGAQQFVQIDLVGAFENRVGIVNHHHAFAFSFFGELVGVVINTGGFADKQGVKFGQPPVILLLDQFDVDPALAPGLDELLQRFGVGGWHFLLGIVQHRQIVAVVTARPGLPPAPAEIRRQRAHEYFFLVGGQRMQVQGLDGGDAPFALQAEFHPQQWRAESVEQLPGQFLQFPGRALAEVDIQFKSGGGKAGPGFAQHLLDVIVQVLDVQAVDGLAAEVVERAHAGDDPVATGLGQQRTVITDTEVAVAAAEVQHPQIAAGRGVFGLGQIVFSGDDRQVRKVRFPFGGVFHQDDVIGHRLNSALLTPLGMRLRQ